MTETVGHLLTPDEIAEKVAGLLVSKNRSTVDDDTISDIINNESPELINQLTPLRSSLFRGLSPQRLEVFIKDIESSVFGETVGGRVMIGYLHGRIDHARDIGQVKRGLSNALEEIDRLTT